MPGEPSGDGTCAHLRSELNDVSCDWSFACYCDTTPQAVINGGARGDDDADWISIGRDGSGALSLDGVDDYVEFPEGVYEDIGGAGPRTICAWALAGDDAAGREAGLFSFGANAAANDF